ncbi:MAG: isopenicillin N synthase family dioxygenase [Pseudomonadales bacterium]
MSASASHPPPNDIPVIDAARLPHDTRALAQVDYALREWGCFYITGFAADLPAEGMAALSAQMRALFALPLARKRIIERSAANAWGYYDRELTKNVVDWKQIYDFGPEHGANRPQWPAELPGFRPAVAGYYRACESLAHRLLGAISVCLDMPADHLRRDFDAHTSFLRMNYYPRCADAARPDAPTGSREGRFGINHHTDAGALTLLLQDDQPGLQVLRDGAWHLVPPIPGTLTVNVGDIVQVWSNDRYPAALHRVIASPARERFSAAFFFNPSYAADYAPLAGACHAEPPRYRSINWGEFRARRAAGDYADLGDEVQIGDYRTAP